MYIVSQHSYNIYHTYSNKCPEGGVAINVSWKGHSCNKILANVRNSGVLSSEKEIQIW